MIEFSADEIEPTVGACQRYLQERKKEKEIDPESTKAIDRPSLRGRRSDMNKWKIRTPEMTEEEYQIAIKKHRRKLTAKWQKENKEYLREYMRQYRKLKNR
jgi:hypothetical protein